MGQVVVIGGPSGSGKTLAALNLAVFALRQGTSVLYFSLEMTWSELAVRLRPIVTGQDITQYEYGSGYSREAAEAADRELVGLAGKLHLNTEPIWQLSDIRGAIESAYVGSGVRLFVVDYAQLVEPSGSDQRLFEAITSISTQLRYTAKKLGAAMVVVSQLNRETTRNRKAPPTIDGLFGSSRLGHDADQVLILDDRKRERVPEHRAIRMEMVLAKNRNGPQLTIPVELSTATLRFRQIMPDEEASWPGAGS